MIGHPGTERADLVAGGVRAVRRDGCGRYGAKKIKAALERRGAPRPGGASAASRANGACGRVHAQTVRTARDAGRRGQAREPAGPAVRRLRVLLQFFLSNFCTIFPQYRLPVSRRNCTV